MTADPIPRLSGAAPSDAMRARWARLADDFARLPMITEPADVGASIPREVGLRDVGDLLLRGHDEALAEAERYVVIGHTMRTGHVVEFDDIDDRVALARWVRELDHASSEGFAPPAPAGFWASFLRWRTPLGMARLSDRRRTPVPPPAREPSA